MGTALAVALGNPFNASPLPGAGRWRDYCFPEPAFLGPTLNQQQAGIRPASNGATAFPIFARTVYTADPGQPTGPVMFNGVNVMAVLSGAAAGQGFACTCIQPRLTPTPLTVDDMAFNRIVFIGMGMGNPPGGAATDVGGYVVIPNSGTPDMRVMSGGISGFGFQFPTQSTVQFVIRGPNGLVTLAIPQINDLLLHTYEMRILPSTRTAYAQLQVFVDFVPLALPALSSSWAPGTNLPSIAITSNRMGFAPGLINNCLASANLLINQLRVIQAPTLQDCF